MAQAVKAHGQNAVPKMLGIWNGVYSYAKATPFIDVPFEMVVRKVAGGAFLGAIQDNDCAGGQVDTGKIVGRLSKGGRIDFIKEMPTALALFPDGILRNFDGRPQRIRYRGKYIESGYFRGTWSTSLEVFIHQGRLLVFRPSRGTWKMCKTGGPPAL